jgi:hypothetical protein
MFSHRFRADEDQCTDGATALVLRAAMGESGTCQETVTLAQADAIFQNLTTAVGCTNSTGPLTVHQPLHTLLLPFATGHS